LILVNNKADLIDQAVHWVKAKTLAQFIMGDDTLQLHRLAVIRLVDASGLSIGEEKGMWNVVGVCIPSGSG
jgi:hypothetical protein